MRSGQLNRRVKIQGDSIAEDDFGGEVQSWTDVLTVWAEIQYGSGGERRVGVAQEQASHPVSVIVRKSTTTSAINPLSHRLQFDSKNWDIESAVPHRTDNRFMVITAVARV